MKVNEVLNIDFRPNKNRIIVQNILKKIGPLKKYNDLEEIPIDKLEKFITLCCKKYSMNVGFISMDTNASDIPVYTVHLHDDNGNSIGSVFGCCLYELFCKISIKMWDMIKKEKVKGR